MQRARVQAEVIQGEESKNGPCLALKQGNVVTFEATSRRYREDICQRRDVPKDVSKQRRDVAHQRHNVPETANNQRRDVGFSRRDVLEMFIINVATCITHVATFQRHSKSTSRR